MATPPDEVRTGLTLVTSAALAEVSGSIASAPPDPTIVRGVLFEVVPFVVDAFTEGSSALALDWYEELREESPATAAFTPSPVALVRDEFLDAATAWATEPLYDLQRQIDDLAVDMLAQIEAATQESLARLEPVVQKEVAAGFWDTMTDNVERDPDAVGWRRFAREGACPLCRMLSDKGAVYRADTAKFAAHTSCHCVVAPVFDGEPGEEADVMQYVASSKRRTDADRAKLRAYLKANYGA